jgi:hypothetical protein
MLDITGLAPSSLAKGLKGLKKRNILLTPQTESKTYITYKINSKLSTWKSQYSTNVKSTNVEQLLHKRRRFTPQTETTPIKDNKDKRHLAIGFQNRNYSSEFEKLWFNYPNGAGKAAAFKAFKKVCPDDQKEGVMVDFFISRIGGQKAHKKHLSDKNEFVPGWPHLSTWLNNERWNDEVKTIVRVDDLEAKKKKIAAQQAYLTGSQQ